MLAFQPLPAFKISCPVKQEQTHSTIPWKSPQWFLRRSLPVVAQVLASGSEGPKSWEYLSATPVFQQEALLSTAYLLPDGWCLTLCVSCLWHGNFVGFIPEMGQVKQVKNIGTRADPHPSAFLSSFYTCDLQTPNRPMNYTTNSQQMSQVFTHAWWRYKQSSHYEEKLSIWAEPKQVTKPM